MTIDRTFFPPLLAALAVVALVASPVPSGADTVAKDGNREFVWLERRAIAAPDPLAAALSAVLTREDRENLVGGQVRTYVALHDLNRDGQDEAIVHVAGSHYCRMVGCPTFVFTQDQDGRWREIGQTPVQFEERQREDGRSAFLPMVAVSAYGFDGWPAILAGHHMLRWIGERYTLDPMQPGHGLMDYRYVPKEIEFRPTTAARAKALIRRIREQKPYSSLDVRPDRVHIADVDLNGDGRNETIVGIRDSGYCGSSGCDGYVLSAAPELRILGGFLHGGSVTLWPERIDGWRSIEGSESGLRWNGADYDYFCIGHRCDERIEYDER